MTDKNIDIKHVCHDCVGDQILATAIKENGTTNECSYCGDSRDAVDLDDLADRIHEVIENHFERSSSEPDWLSSIMLRETMLDWWVPDGQPVVDLMADIACVTEEIAKDLTDLLSGRFRYPAIKYGGEDPYDSEAYYEERSPNDLGYRFSWNAFRNEITYRERFFPGSAEPVLDDIFRDLRDLKTYDGTPVIREVAPDEKVFSVWRARTAQSEEELVRILKCPENQLGAPPSSSAEAGRMNAKGISVFYGAMEKSTCVSEVRPPVGSYVVVGKFELLRPGRLLDLGALSEVYIKVSYFDPEYASLKGRAAFLQHLVNEISKPVMPQDVDREYLPTQFVASYLAHKVSPHLDGIIFPSSQTEGKGHNIVLFNSSRGVEPSNLPSGTVVDVSLPHHYQGYEDFESAVVVETVPSELPGEEQQVSTRRRQHGPIRLSDYNEPEETEPYSEPTLKLIPGSVDYLRIKGVDYSCNSHSVSRHRQTEQERDAFKQQFEQGGRVNFDDIFLENA